ncbi:MAG TPA: DUF2341 domain-containing protein [Alphaproteobacteria bacterium]|nr:DUF2341 domain-containing protein [Alphaproteobacteria bacterium]
MQIVEQRILTRALHFFGWIVIGLYFLVHATTAFALNFNVTLASLTNHNTSAYPAYNEANFPANFGTDTWVNQNGTTMPVDPTHYDESLNPITPAHVSKMDVHTLIPSRPDLRWFANATPWFGSSSHINIGLNNDTTNYVASMITDLKNRGFNGLIISWYGQGSFEDAVTLKIQSYLDSLPTNNFTFIIMLDVGVSGGTSISNLEVQIQYLQSQYFNDPNYEREPTNSGLPILMFFDVRNTIGESNMNTLKADTGGQMVWVEQGSSYLSEPWEDECFEWTDEYDTGVNTNDPFNLIGVTNNYPTIQSSGKKAFGGMCAHFDGTLTKSISWSLGKYLASSNGLCEVERAAAINSIIPANMTRMQWATWSDWEEGTEVEAATENAVSITNEILSPNYLYWNLASGDVRTIDHYEVYVSTNGVTAALLESLPSSVHVMSLSGALPPGVYSLYVDAVGKPCIRDHMSPPLTYITATAPIIVTNVQPLFQQVFQSDPISFYISAAGNQPLSYQWLLNGQVVAGATNSTYSFPALVGSNDYQVVVSNSDGSADSSVATVVGVPETILNPVNYNRMQITFGGYTNGETLLDFPALVRLGTSIPGFSYSQFASPANGADLRFTAENGRELPYQIDTWNPSGESYIWVQVPSIGSSTDYITACWGNTEDSAVQPWTTNGEVWETLTDSNAFELVYHLGQTNFPFPDSTLKYPADSGVAPPPAAGIVGNGNAFNGSSEFLDAGLVPVSKTFTVSAWVNIAPTASSEQTIWCNKSGGWNVDGFDFYVNSYNASDGIIYFDTADGVGGDVPQRTATNAVTFGQWHLLTGSMDGINGAAHVYVDGVDETINTSVDTAFQVTNYVRCGSLLTGTPGTGGDLYFDGTMDETRIEDSVRDAAWVWASWATVADNAFATYSPVVPATPILYGQMVNGQLVLTWANGILQSAPSVAGPYSDVTGATSPNAVAPSLSQQYFRLRVP